MNIIGFRTSSIPIVLQHTIFPQPIHFVDIVDDLGLPLVLVKTGKVKVEFKVVSIVHFITDELKLNELIATVDVQPEIKYNVYIHSAFSMYYLLHYGTKEISTIPFSISCLQGSEPDNKLMKIATTDSNTAKTIFIEKYKEYAFKTLGVDPIEKVYMGNLDFLIKEGKVYAKFKDFNGPQEYWRIFKI